MVGIVSERTLNSRLINPSKDSVYGIDTICELLKQFSSVGKSAGASLTLSKEKCLYLYFKLTMGTLVKDSNFKLRLERLNKDAIGKSKSLVDPTSLKY